MRAEQHSEIICVHGNEGRAACLLEWGPTLPIEPTFDVPGGRRGQVWRLASTGEDKLLLRLFREVWRRALALGLERLYIGVSPDDVAYYEMTLCFRRVESEPRFWPLANAPAMLLVLDVEAALSEREARQSLRRFAGRIKE